MSTSNLPALGAVIGERPLRGLEVVLAQLGDTMGPDLIIGSVRGPMTLDVLRQACFRVQQRHPTLRAAIRWPDGDRALRPVLHAFEPSIDRLDVCVVEQEDPRADGSDAPDWRTTHAAFWQWVAQEQSRHRFDLESGFLFRVVWVPDGEDGGHLIVCGHHAIVDGTSLMRLLDQILRDAGELQQAVDTGAASGTVAAGQLPPVQPLPMSQALLWHLKFGPLEKLLTWIGLRQAISEQRHFTRKPWLPLARHAQGDVATQSITTQCVFTQGEKRNWAQLHQQCKAQGVTVGGAFSAAVQFAVCRHLRNSGVALPMAGGKIAVPLSMDYNMRDRIDHGRIDAEAIGLGTSIASVGVKVAADTAFWDLARRIMRNARLQVRLRIPKLFQGVTDTLFDYANFVRRHGIDHGLSGGAGDGVNISNVGRYPFPIEAGPFALRHVFGFNGACRSGPMFIFWLRQVDDHLCYNAIACSPAADRPMLEAIFADIVDLMEHLAPSESARQLLLGDYADADRRQVPATLAAALR